MLRNLFRGRHQVIQKGIPKKKFPWEESFLRGTFGVKGLSSLFDRPLRENFIDVFGVVGAEPELSIHLTGEHEPAAG